jgi:ABC-type transport system substrate-binding protein
VKLLKSAMLLLLLVSLMVPAMATENALVTEETVCRVGKLPAEWNPMDISTEESRLLLELTGDRLYSSAADGSILPSLAAAMPVDVTAQYAGDSAYDIPANAPRGYAFRIDLISDGKWEDGTPICAEDWLYTLQIMARNGWEFPFANLEAYRTGAVRDAETVISLEQAGYASEAEARAAGITSFYLNDITYCK